MNFGDTVIRRLQDDVETSTLEVLAKSVRPGVAVRAWGKHDNLLHRFDLTPAEAHRLAAALSHAASCTEAFDQLVNHTTKK